MGGECGYARDGDDDEGARRLEQGQSTLHYWSHLFHRHTCGRGVGVDAAAAVHVRRRGEEEGVTCGRKRRRREEGAQEGGS